MKSNDTQKIFNKRDLIYKIWESNNDTLSKYTCEKLIESIFEVIKDNVNSGKKVSIGGFGIFRTKLFGKTKARNPRTGEIVSVDKMRRIRFTPTLSFKEKVR